MTRKTQPLGHYERTTCVYLDRVSPDGTICDAEAKQETLKLRSNYQCYRTTASVLTTAPAFCVRSFSEKSPLSVAGYPTQHRCNGDEQNELFEAEFHLSLNEICGNSATLVLVFRFAHR